MSTITPEEKWQIYKLLKLKVLVDVERTVAVELVSGLAPGYDAGPVEVKDLCS